MKNGEAWYNRPVEREWYDPADPAHVIDVRHPWPARVDNHLAGGFECFSPDREMVATLGASTGSNMLSALENRAWNTRVAKWVLNQGYRQFLDLGSGYPANDDVYELAWGRGGVSAVYVDVDRAAVAHLRTSRDCERGKYAHVLDDIADADGLLSLPKVQETLDFTQPIVLVLSSVLQFLSSDEAHAALALYKHAVAPSSLLVLSHPLAGHEAVQALAEAYMGCGIPCTPRSRDEMTEFFAGWDLCAPGLCPTVAWHAPGVATPEVAGPRWRKSVENHGTTAYAGVAKKPEVAV